MITQNQIDNLKEGDKLIFFRDGGVLSTNEGNVFTFSNWYKSDDRWFNGKHYWQSLELHKQGNHKHNFSIYDTELFDDKIHKNYVMMDEEKLNPLRQDFIDKYGA